jgi:hypothetical protein
MRKLRSRLTFANVCSFLALVIALGTGSAYAANTVFSTDIVNGEVKSVDVGTDEVRSADVRDDSLAGGGLAGRDIRDHSGVDTCPDGSERLGQLCFRASHLNINWEAANFFCRDVDLRLPTPTEGLWLEANHDLGIGNAAFWTEEFNDINSVLFVAKDALSPKGFIGSAQPSSTSPQTVCVTTPTN